MRTGIPTFSQLLDNEIFLQSCYDGTCHLYEYEGINYVVLPTNDVMTQQEDNINGIDEALFPIS